MNGPGASQLLEFLKSSRGRAALSGCISPASEAEAGARDTMGHESLATSAPVYPVAVVDWWLPRCSLEHNGYNDPSRVIGPPDAVALGGKDEYQGFMSLGQGGYATVDTGVAAVDGDGPDVRVFQTVSGEPVTLYAASNPQGPFRLVGLRVSCGARTTGIFSHHCDFDLAGTGLAEARYFKIEDGEIYPCLKAGTITEGADVDALLDASRREYRILGPSLLLLHMRLGGGGDRDHPSGPSSDTMIGSRHPPPGVSIPKRVP